MQRTIIIGEPVTMSVLGAPLDPLVERFYTDYLAGRDLPWDELDVAAGTYSTSTPPTPQRMMIISIISSRSGVISWATTITCAPSSFGIAPSNQRFAWEQAHPGQFRTENCVLLLGDDRDPSPRYGPWLPNHPPRPR